MEAKKIVLVGSSSVGKTSILKAYKDHQPGIKVAPTVIINCEVCEVDVDGSIVPLAIWDTAGQEKYESVAPMYCHGAYGAICVFDLTKRNTFDRAKSWIKYVQEICGDDVVIVLVGNKLDLVGKEDEEGVVPDEDTDELAKAYGIPWFKTSALTLENVDKVMEEVARCVSGKQAADGSIVVNDEKKCC